MTFKQAPRTPPDGRISVDRIPTGFAITCVDHGFERTIEASEYNASRLVAALAVLLGIRINPADAKEIKL